MAIDHDNNEIVKVSKDFARQAERAAKSMPWPTAADYVKHVLSQKAQGADITMHDSGLNVTAPPEGANPLTLDDLEGLHRT